MILMEWEKLADLEKRHRTSDGIFSAYATPTYQQVCPEPVMLTMGTSPTQAVPFLSPPGLECLILVDKANRDQILQGPHWGWTNRGSRLRSF